MRDLRGFRVKAVWEARNTPAPGKTILLRRPLYPAPLPSWLATQKPMVIGAKKLWNREAVVMWAEDEARINRAS